MTLGITAAGVTAAAAVGGLGLGVYNTIAGPGGGGGGFDMAMMEPKIQELPSYNWMTDPNYGAAGGVYPYLADFGLDEHQRIRSGELPEYFTSNLPGFRENLERPLRQAYEGRPGERTGILGLAQQAGSIGGLGPANQAAMVNKQLYEYATKEKQIDEYLTKLGFDVMQTGIYAIPQMLMGLPKGPDIAITSPFAPAQTVSRPAQNTLGNLAGQLAGQIGGRAIDNFFDQQPQQQQPGGGYYSPYTSLSSQNISGLPGSEYSLANTLGPSLATFGTGGTGGYGSGGFGDYSISSQSVGLGGSPYDFSIT